MTRIVPSNSTYLDTPAGIVTVAGTHFRTTEKLLLEFAAQVFEREPLERLIRRTEVWTRAPVTITLWALPVLLYLFPIGLAVPAGLVLFSLWRVLSPSWPMGGGIAAVAVAQIPLLQAVYYVIVLTLLAWGGEPLAVITGLAGFIFLRFGLVDKLLSPILGPLLSRMYSLPVPDQVLRALIIRAALKHNIPLAELSEIEQSARGAWTLRRKR